jgi:hypothetical protein
MEIIFDVIILCLSIISIWMVFFTMTNLYKWYVKLLQIEEKISVFLRQSGEDIDALQCDVAKLSKQMDALPDIVKEDNYRTLLAFKESLEPPRPIKPNNWDSIREAFTRPTRPDVRD